MTASLFGISSPSCLNVPGSLNLAINLGRQADLPWPLYNNLLAFLAGDGLASFNANLFTLLFLNSATNFARYRVALLGRDVHANLE